MILLSIDTLRADVLTPYDPAQDTTPNLQALAERSILFEDVLAQAPSTAISHKSIFYSLYPAIHKTTKAQVPAEHLTSPLEVLQEVGFRTVAFVDGGQLHEKYGFAKGFDSYLSALKEEKSLERLLTDAVAWLEAHGDDSFFLFLHTYQTHAPYAPPEPWRSRYAGWYDGDDPLIDERRGDLAVEAGSDEQRAIVDLYRAEVAYVDDFLGRLFEELERLGLWEETILVFLSDHGESLGEQGYVGHNRFLREQLEIPLIVWMPGYEARRIAYPVEALDVMPTLFSLLDLRPPYEFQGRDLTPLMRGRSAPDRGRVRLAEQAGRAVAQEVRWKALLDIDEPAKDALFDLDADPERSVQPAGELRDTLDSLRGVYVDRMAEAEDLAERFVTDGAYDPTTDAAVSDELRALGYVN